MDRPLSPAARGPGADRKRGKECNLWGLYTIVANGLSLTHDPHDHPTRPLSPVVHERLDGFLRQQTDLWNAALEERINGYRKTGEGISSYDQFKSLTEIRQDESFARFRADCQRSSLRRLDKAFKRFFARVKKGEKPGFPRFKSKARPIRSFDIPKPVISGTNLYVKGMGNFRLRAIPEEPIKAARVVKTARRIQVQFMVEVGATPRKPDAPIGIDVGLKERAAFSDGEAIPKVTLDRRALKRKQRALSRAEKGSKNREKKRMALAREWDRVRTIKHNELHEITSEIVKKHNRIAVEDLKITNMVKNRNLSRSIQEQTWGKFVDMLTYKAESAGGEVIRVPPRHTSMDCSACGNRQPMPPGVRTFCCKGCGLVLDRDVNAARNILRRGIALAGWEIEPKACPGASENGSANEYAFALAGQDAERLQVTL